MKILGAAISPFVRKVLAVCEIKGLNYEHETVLPGDTSPEYLAISPLGKIPALSDGDFSISDSSVICQYLEEKYPATPVLPQSPEDRARCRWLEEYADSRLVESVAPFFFERKVKPMLGMGETDEARLTELAQTAVPECLAYVESQVPEDGFIFGDISLADISLASPLINATYANIPWPDGQYPKTAAFLKRVRAHSAIAPLLEADAQMLGG